MIPRLVLHFTDADDTSGYFPQLARWHDRRRYRMVFGTLRPMAPWLRHAMQRDGITCVSADARSRREYPAAAIRLARWLRRARIEILHTHLFEPSVVGLFAGVLARTPLRVMTRHYSDYHTRIDKTWHVRLDRCATAMSHRVIAISQHTADHLRDVEHVPSSKIRVVPNGIDFDRVRVSDSQASSRLRLEFSGEHGALLVLPARLHPEKGQSYLFRALPEVRSRIQRPIAVVVAGIGSFEAAYRDEVHALGCADIVHFAGFRRDIADLMTAADLVVLPSVAEGFGLVLAEALYLGTPVVATRVGGIPEIVIDQRHGFLVPPEDPPALAEAIVRLISDETRRRQMGAAGRTWVEDRFAFGRMVQGYERVYEELLEPAGSV